MTTDSSAATQLIVSTYNLIITPAKGHPGKYVDDLGLLKRPTAQPLHDGARALAALGHTDDTRVAMSHQGDDFVSMTGTVGKLKLFKVVERDRGGLAVERYEEFPSHLIAEAA